MAGMFKAFLRTIHLSPDSSAALPPASLKKRPRAPDTELPLLVTLEELYTGGAGLLLGGVGGSGCWVFCTTGEVGTKFCIMTAGEGVEGAVLHARWGRGVWL